jgi:hypothetical protein
MTDMVSCTTAGCDGQIEPAGWRSRGTKYVWIPPTCTKCGTIVYKKVSVPTAQLTPYGVKTGDLRKDGRRRELGVRRVHPSVVWRMWPLMVLHDFNYTGEVFVEETAGFRGFHFLQ